MNTINVYATPRTAFAKFAFLRYLLPAIACLVIAHPALCADTPDRRSPDGRISLTVTGTDTASQALEIRDTKTGETTTLAKTLHLPLLGDLAAVGVQWSSDSRFFVISDTAGGGYVGYIVAFGKHPREIFVSGLGNGVIRGGVLRSFEIDSQNRVILDIHSEKLGRRPFVLRVAEDGRVHGGGAK